MKKGGNFSCIIPFYNEAANILGVVEPVSKVKLVNQTICVDGGSTDGGTLLIKKTFPHVKLVRIERKSGKSENVIKGLESVVNDQIIILDADLKNVTSREIEDLLHKFQADRSIDVLIIKVGGGNNWFDRIQRKEIIFSGNRIVKRDDLAAVARLRPQGYRLEVEMNRYLERKHKKVVWAESQIKNVHKIKKWGFMEGMKRSVGMEVDLLLFLGPIEYARQVLFFAWDRVA